MPLVVTPSALSSTTVPAASVKYVKFRLGVLPAVTSAAVIFTIVPSHTGAGSVTLTTGIGLIVT
ncbi:hypothetical protein FLCH110379_18170 [Flavobacterium chungbukense]